MVVDRSRHSIGGTNQGGSLVEEGSDEVAEPVRMGKWDDSEIHVLWTDAHRFTDISAVGQEL